MGFSKARDPRGSVGALAGPRRSEGARLPFGEYLRKPGSMALQRGEPTFAVTRWLAKGHARAIVAIRRGKGAWVGEEANPKILGSLGPGAYAGSPLQLARRASRELSSKALRERAWPGSSSHDARRS